MAHPTKIILLLLAALLLVAGLKGFQRQSALAALPVDLQIPPSAFPVQLEGIQADNLEALRFLVEGFPAAEPLALHTMSSSRPQSLVPVRAHGQAYLMVTLISGVFFWVMATLVFLPRLDLPAVPQFFFITLLYGSGVLVGGVYFQTDLQLLGLLLSLIQIGSLALLPVVFLHLALVFPVRQSLRGWGTRAPWLLYGLALVLVTWQATAFVRHFGNPGPRTFAALSTPQTVADVVMVLEVVFGFVLLLRQERILGPCSERQQVRWLLLGFILGASPYVFLRTLPQLLDLAAPFPAYLDRVFEPAIPLAFVFAIVRYRFLDIDIILRRGLLYGLLAGVGVLLVLVPVATISPGWSQRWSLLEKLLPVTGGLAAGLLFLPLRRILASWIDRTFFKIGHRLESLSRELEDVLKSASSQPEVLEHLVATVIRGVDPRGLAAGLDQGGEQYVTGEGVPPDCPGPWLKGALEDRGGIQVLAAPKATTDPDVEAIDFPRQLSRRGWVLAVPLVLGSRPHGALYLGPKRTGHRFVRTELVFLEAVAEAASRRLGEIGLIQKVIEERLARQHLDDLGKLKDDFLSKVAHDLRTPVTSLGWSLRNLLDGLTGAVNARQAEYLEAMRQAVAHLDRLVAGLLEVSRLETTEVELPLGPVRIGDMADRALSTVRPLAEVRGIQLRRSIPADLSFARAHPDKLAEVLINLLDNAVRYSPDGDTVEVAAEDQGEKVLLRVRDHGPGFTGIDDPFARFKQGTPSPQGEGGYGLGLTIAQEYMVLMGGTIEARNHPAGGAEFTLGLQGTPRPLEGESHEA